MTAEPALTLAQFEIASPALEAAGIHVSLLDGQIVRKFSSSAARGQCLTELITGLLTHVRAHNLGGVLVSQTTAFLFLPSHCPEPDIAYLSQRRKPTRQYCIADAWPEFILQVMDDSLPDSEVARRQRDRATWVARGAVVYDLYPEERLVRVYDSEGERVEREDLTFAALPGLRMPLADLW